MQCRQCGEQVPEGACFCGQCGARQEPAPRDGAPEASPERETPGLVGRLIAGRYRLLRLVGEGGMGSVYEAEQSLGSSQRSVAVKLLRPEWSHDPAVQARFHREAATVARLEHFNTVRVYDFGTTDDGTLFIVMEYLQGRSLQKVLDEHGPLPPERARHIAGQLAASLDEAHGLGIVHRDLKPDNILLVDAYASQRDVVKIVDFGIAKSRPELGAATTKLTELGAFVGTPAYMSPEQFTASGVTQQSDIYSLGVTVHQMLAGRLPFTAGSALEWAQAHMTQPPAPLEEQYGAGPIPEHMRRAVLRALSKEPSARQASAGELSRELSGEAAAAAEPWSIAAAGAPALASAGGPNTAPMRQWPSAGVGAVPTTQPMAAIPEVRRAPPAPFDVVRVSVPPQAPPRSRRLLGALLTLATVLGAALLFVALDGQRWLLARLEGPPEPPEPIASAPASSVPEPEPPEPDPAPAPEPPGAERPTARQPAPRPRPAPAPTRPAPGASAPAPAPPSPAPSPSAGGAPAQPPPPPSTLPLPSTLTWSLPTAGACERCMQALQTRGNYGVVTAVAESLLCEDRAARESCERQIGETAPALAERAAREGDCPAALATAAAAVNVRVPPERFAAVNALCLR